MIVFLMGMLNCFVLGIYAVFFLLGIFCGSALLYCVFIVLLDVTLFIIRLKRSVFRKSHD